MTSKPDIPRERAEQDIDEAIDYYLSKSRVRLHRRLGNRRIAILEGIQILAHVALPRAIANDPHLDAAFSSAAEPVKL